MFQSAHIYFYEYTLLYVVWAVSDTVRQNGDIVVYVCVKESQAKARMKMKK